MQTSTVAADCDRGQGGDTRHQARLLGCHWQLAASANGRLMFPASSSQSYLGKTSIRLLAIIMSITMTHMNSHRKTVKHYHEPGDLHELTFSCYERRQLLT